jgi:hypothetical protein
VAELDQLNPSEAGIQAALDKVSTNLMALKASAKGQWGSQLKVQAAAIQRRPCRRQCR